MNIGLENHMYTTDVKDEPYYPSYYDYLYHEYMKTCEVDTDYYYNEFEEYIESYNEECEYLESLILTEPV